MAMTTASDAIVTTSPGKVPPGKVYLVGAGPGDPGLLTLRGAECLAVSDLVLYDGLVNPLLLRMTKGVCERTARARRDGTSIVPQHEINERLIAEARAGKVVTRLKGGDPYIFGRGSEEAAALAEAGIPFEVIPGVTAATGAGEYAGFSFTHRDISSAVAFVTGHEDPTRGESRLNYASLAQFPGTLVFYMGLNRLPEICRQLRHAGMTASTPAAVVCQASLPTQKVVEGTLETLPNLVQLASLKPPSLIVVGQCVTQRSQLNWFERLPLFGLSIGITRPEDQADDIASQIVRLGGEPVLMPMIEVGPMPESSTAGIREVLRRIAEFDWLIFTSVNGVSEFFRHLFDAALDVRCLGSVKLAAIGTSTAERLRTFGLKADLIPSQFRGEALAAEVSSVAKGQRVLWARATRGRDVIPEMLTAAGIHVEQLTVYDNRDVQTFSPEIIARLKNHSLDWIGLSSPSIARRFADLLQAAGISPNELQTKLVTISPVTSSAATDFGLKVSAEATTYTWAGMLDAIQEARSIDS